MAILKTSHTEYTPMPQQAEVTYVKDIPQNGDIVVTQVYVDAATAQVRKSEMGLDKGLEEGDSKDQTCGWGPFSPGICQRFRTAGWVCFWLSWAGAIQVNTAVKCFHANLSWTPSSPAKEMKYAS